MLTATDYAWFHNDGERATYELAHFAPALPAKRRAADRGTPADAAGLAPRHGSADARWRAGSANGLFLAAQAGHNAESHNHNDASCFIVALDGRPVIIDAGVSAYTRQTFGPDRYQLWTM